MLALFKKIKYTKGEETRVKDEVLMEQIAEPVAANVQVDDASLRKSIAEKLEGYQPADKQANFSGPGYFHQQKENQKQASP